MLLMHTCSGYQVCLCLPSVGVRDGGRICVCKRGMFARRVIMATIILRYHESQGWRVRVLGRTHCAECRPISSCASTLPNSMFVLLTCRPRRLLSLESASC